MTDRFEKWAQDLDDDWDAQVASDWKGRSGRAYRSNDTHIKTTKGPERDELIRQLRLAVRERVYWIPATEIVEQMMTGGRPRYGVNGNAARALQIEAMRRRNGHNDRADTSPL